MNENIAIDRFVMKNSDALCRNVAHGRPRDGSGASDVGPSLAPSSPL